MNPKIKLVLSLAIVFTIFTQSTIRADQMTITFPVLGNCYLCKLRIEEAVNTLPGIDTVNWNYATKVTMVTYNDELVDAFMLMHTIANVGHDTEWYPAPDSAYELLIGTCCEYERTNDYTNVQVGYLSLMGIWVSGVGIGEPEQQIEFALFPTIGTGIFQYESDSWIDSMEAGIKVYSMAGAEVYSCPMERRGRLDLGFLQKGHYILVVADSRKILSRSKLIKL